MLQSLKTFFPVIPSRNLFYAKLNCKTGLCKMWLVGGILKYRGFQNIESSQFMEVQQHNVEGVDNSFNDLIDFAENENIYKEDCFNIFITESLANGGLNIISGFAWTFGNDICIRDTNLNSRTLLHEMGHCFSLLHTDNTNNNTLVENVTRDVNSPNYNALTHGDRVHDTPATPFGIQSNTIFNCVWTGYAIDNVGQQYPNILLNNLMGPFSSSCLSISFLIFTQGQKLRMRHAISNSYPGYNAYRTSIEELYEPFEIGTIQGSQIYSITENVPHDGTAYVCKDILMQHRFQKGFTYEFTNTELPDPSSASINQIPEINNNTAQFGVKILQLNNPNSTWGNYIHNINVVCTRGQICNHEPYIGGKRLTTNSLGSNQINEVILDSDDLDNPNFVDDLESQKYHIITKNTETGAQIQQTIYKN